MAALSRAHEHADKRLDDEDNKAQMQAFNDFQSAFAFAAIIGKLLWPSASQKTSQITISRGVRLRALIGIQSDPLLQNWKIRNHFEHLDERIDAWSATPDRPVVLYHFGSPVSGAASGETFNRYDYESDEFHMLEHSVSMTELRKSVLAIQEAALKAIQLDSPGQWTPKPLQ